MQLCALDKTKNIISSQKAFKKTDYTCLVCGEKVRLRGGFCLRKHFYHLNSPNKCHGRAKSLIHSQIQYKLQQLLPGSQLEYYFLKTKRIADVVWWPEHIIFEIQCSPISAYEINARNFDYEKLGFSVVWILHDRCFNKKKLSPAEVLLENTPHYFTNIDKNGRGYFYDQYSNIVNKKRIHSEVFNVDISRPFFHGPMFKNRPTPIFLRLQNSRLYFSGDFVDAVISKKINLNKIKPPQKEIKISHYRNILDAIIFVIGK